MYKIIAALIFAAVVIGVGIGIPDATGMVGESGPQRALKGDRLTPQPIGPTCTPAAWPHYESRCVRNRTQPSAQPREVRIVSADRPAPVHPASLSTN